MCLMGDFQILCMNFEFAFVVVLGNKTETNITVMQYMHLISGHLASGTEI